MPKKFYPEQSQRTGFTLVRSAKVNTLGFTLIELLVVISIIAILSAIGLVVYSTVLKSSRDAKRQADLKFVQSGLEQYFADQKYYPLLGSGNCPSTGDGLFRVGCALTNTNGSKTYITQVPNDPTKNPDYSYIPSFNGCNNSTQNCINYCLFAKLENTTLLNSPGCSQPGLYGLSKP